MGIKIGSHLEIVFYRYRFELILIEPIQKLKGFLSGIDTKIDREKDRI